MEDLTETRFSQSLHQSYQRSPYWHEGFSQTEGGIIRVIPGHNGVKQGCVLAPTLFSVFFIGCSMARI